MFAIFLLGAGGLGALAATPYQGYTFCASGSHGYLLDMSGSVVHSWTASGAAQTCAYLLADGSALFPIQNSTCTQPHHDGTYPSGRFQKISWDGAILWDYRFCDSTVRAGYDVEPMPNGNILIPTDASSRAKIFEVQPTGTSTGTIVWQCALPDSLAGSNTYMNSVSYNPELDLVLVDMQTPVRKLVVIDHGVNPGQVVHTYRVTGSGRVHAAIWVHKYFLGTSTVMPDHDAGAMRLNNLLVVHNGGDRVAEFTYAGVLSSIPYSFQDHEGSVQRLPNGNTLVTRGGSTTIAELNDAGQVVATLTAPGPVQRAYRWGPTFSGLQQLFPDAVPDPPSSPATVRFVYDRATETGKVLLAEPNGVPAVVRVFSVDGGIVYAATTWGATASFSTESLASGMYFVQVRQAGGDFSTRFVKVR